MERRLANADDLLDAYDSACLQLDSDMETGWDEDGCRAVYERRIRRLRAIIVERLYMTATTRPPLEDDVRDSLTVALDEAQSLHQIVGDKINPLTDALTSLTRMLTTRRLPADTGTTP